MAFGRRFAEYIIASTCNGEIEQRWRITVCCLACIVPSAGHLMSPRLYLSVEAICSMNGSMNRPLLGAQESIMVDVDYAWRSTGAPLCRYMWAYVVCTFVHASFYACSFTGGIPWLLSISAVVLPWKGEKRSVGCPSPAQTWGIRPSAESAGPHHAGDGRGRVVQQQTANALQIEPMA